MNSRIAWAACIALLLVGFFAFVFYLDRYPPPYYDEGAYNQPAVRTLEGLSINWPMAVSAPYGTLVWGYHGPFFPHMQVLTFRLLGVSAFASRIPQFVAAFLGILLLGGTLIRFGCPWSAILIAVFWLGDRSLVEDLYGRMDGIALLFVVCALGTFTKWLSTGRGVALFWTGVFAGTAMGFHPVTWTFMAGIGAAALLLAPAGARRSVVYYGMGLALPAVAWLAFLAPYFAESLQQFRWYLHNAKHMGLLGRAWNMIVVLRWSRYWAIALVAVTVLFLLPVMAAILLRYRSGASRPHPLILSTGLFALCGFGALLTVNQMPYYLIHFSVWPVAAVLVIIETKGLPRKFHKPALAALALLVVAWLPSAAWNGMRWREARILYPMLDPAPFVDRVRAVVPPGAPIEVSPDYFVLIRPIGHDLVRLPLGLASELPSNKWLVLSNNDVALLGGAQAPGLRGRTVAYSGLLFPGTRAGGSMTVFSPLGAGAKP